MKKKTITILIILAFIACYSFGQCVPTVNYDGCETEVVYHYNYSSFQWYKNTVAIEGAIDWFYEPLTAGIYTVKTMDNSGCIGVSKRVKVISWCGQ